MGRRDSSQEIFKLKPSKDSAEFANLVDFVSHVSPCYPTETAGYAAELMALLDGHHAVLDANLRRSAPSPPLSLSLFLTSPPELRSTGPQHTRGQHRYAPLSWVRSTTVNASCSGRLGSEWMQRLNGYWPLLSRTRRGRVDGVDFVLLRPQPITGSHVP